MIKKISKEYLQKELKKIHNFFVSQNYEVVIEKTSALLKKDPTQVTFYNYIGLSYKQLGQLTKAESILKRGLKKQPKAITLLCNLGAVYRNMEMFSDAEIIFNRALQINPKDTNVLINFGNLKRDLNKIDECIKLYEQAYLINDNIETLLINLAGTYQIIGEFDKSKEVLKNLQLKFPHNIIADKMLSTINFYNTDDNHQKLMIKKINNPDLASENKIPLYFALAKSYSDQKDYKKSSEYFIKGNDAQFNIFKNYNFSDELNLFNTIKEKFTNQVFSTTQSSDVPNLIFVVGLPRSGTTLTHQIISSHSKVYGGGELPVLNSILSKKIFDIDQLDQNYIDALSAEILALFKQFNQNLIILDKSPLNFQWIGFIKLLFPHAKIIHCKRNLKDTALSIYKNVFDGFSLPWSYNQVNLIKFINLYEDLMAFWHAKMPNYIYDCEYEKLVNDQNVETRKIIDFCNLAWEDNCINFEKNGPPIKTVSIAQARKPIYKSSVDLNKNYKDYLDFLEKIEE
ncbi:tetratricopeptide repeat-containing sulfotransferase family protein [Candidatus Pelagibacter sp. Uisw_090]|uniref:tetratricopeptide repeat-containing sulfotransferase family protein n=1 Tax=Candidatus Pelagibacter sp. Uisw_090 TaxID=3230993 RepID=UPI0039E8BEC1